MNDRIGRMTIIGAGAMGSAFARGVISAGLFTPEEITMTDINEALLAQLVEEIGVNVQTDNRVAIDGADVIMLALKPGLLTTVMEGFADDINSSQLVISIVTGIKINEIESNLPANIGVIRSMPNTPCRIGVGAVGFSRGKAATDIQAATAKQIFDAAGISFEVPEKMLDAVTGLSGSGPAYVYLMIEALSDAGVRVGLPRDVSLKLAAQTVNGASRMVLDVNEHPAKLKDQVTTPGGTTITALDVLEKAGLRSALIEAVKAATKRAEELG